MMIEPHPAYLQEAQYNYRDLDLDITWVEAAISDQPCRRSLYYVRDLTGLPYQLKGVASFDKDHLLRHHVARDNIDQITVDCQRLDTILDRWNFWDATVLVIDTEGHEMSVIDSCDFTRFRPRCVVIETLHLSGPCQDRIRQVFKDYQVIVSRTDTLFYL